MKANSEDAMQRETRRDPLAVEGANDRPRRSDIMTGVGGQEPCFDTPSRITFSVNHSQVIEVFSCTI